MWDGGQQFFIIRAAREAHPGDGIFKPLLRYRSGPEIFAQAFPRNTLQGPQNFFDKYHKYPARSLISRT